MRLEFDTGMVIELAPGQLYQVRRYVEKITASRGVKRGSEQRFCWPVRLQRGQAGQINKCTDADGKVSYQESKCLKSASAKTIKPAAPSAGTGNLDDKINGAAQHSAA